MATLEAVRHHTEAEVKGYVEGALRIVGEVELDDELRGIAFAKAIELLSGKVFIQGQEVPASLDLGRMLGKH